jgi:hypothetical protein
MAALGPVDACPATLTHYDADDPPKSTVTRRLSIG